MKKFTKSDARNRLKEEGISPSIHRVKVLEYLLKSKNHPSVDTIYRKLNNEIPTLSKTTIYNILNKFKDHHLVNELRIEDSEVRYEGLPNPHPHFKCTQCHKIYNLSSDCTMFKQSEIEGHQVINRQINLFGICKKCLEKNRKSKKNT